MNPLRWLWRGLRGALLVLAALVLFIEEWGWRPLTAWAARLATWPPLARLEQRILALPPRWALALFIVPAVALFPVKLVALWLIHLGRTTLGVLFIVTLIVASLWIMRPFLAPVIWATMIVAATWPLLKLLQAQAGGSRTVAELSPEEKNLASHRGQALALLAERMRKAGW